MHKESMQQKGELLIPLLAFFKRMHTFLYANLFISLNPYYDQVPWLSERQMRRNHCKLAISARDSLLMYEFQQKHKINPWSACATLFVVRYLRYAIKVKDMTSPFSSSRKEKDDQETVAGLSPEKYGSAAYLDLTYSPSLLADSVLYREAVSLKRIQEEAKKCREFEAQNDNLCDQVEYLRKERDGISESLNKNIAMYKDIIAEMEAKNEARIQEVHKRFSQEMEKNISAKEEEAKYFQAERECFEQRIGQIEGIAQRAQKMFEESQNQNLQLSKNMEKVREQHQEEMKRADKAQLMMMEERRKGEQTAQRLRKERRQAEVAWKEEMNRKIHEKEREVANLQMQHKGELQRAENRKQQELAQKAQEINEMKRTFEAQVKRQEDLGEKKESEATALREESNRLQEKILCMTCEYEKEITHLTHEKSRLMQEIDKLSADCQILRDLNPNALAVENDQLRDLLLESSAELERSKSEMLILAKDNNTLARSLTAAESDAKSWQDSYILSRSRLY